MEYLDYERLTRFGLAFAGYYDAEEGYRKCSRYKVTPQAERIKREGLAAIQKIKDEVGFDNPFDSRPIPIEAYNALAKIYNMLCEVLTENRVPSRRRRV